MPPTHDPKGRTPAQRLRERNAIHDKRREREKPYRAWYRTPRWRELRAFILRRDPSCRMCLHEGRITPACVADHLVEHEGDQVLFWDTLNIWGLCKTCHNSAKQRIEKALGTKSKEQVQGVYEYLRNIYSLTVQIEE